MTRNPKYSLLVISPCIINKMTKLTINPYRNKKSIYQIHIINIIKIILLIFPNYKIKTMKLALENKRKKRKFT